MQAVIFIGIQAAGKSTFFKRRFFDTHVRINRDMLRTRHREDVLLAACIEAKQPFVIDKCNPSPVERHRFITPARAAGFEIVGYYFQSRIAECLARNDLRPPAIRVPHDAVLPTYARLVLPSYDEGFDRLHYVRISEGGGFDVEAWRLQPGVEPGPDAH